MRKTVVAAVVALLAVGTAMIIMQGTQLQCLIAGTVLVMIGVPLLLLSRFQLGKGFAVAPKASILVTHGLYSRIPHPMYAFLDLALLGGVIALRKPWMIVLWLGLVMFQGWQARRETKVLEQAFGDAYRRYRAQTWW